MLDFVETFTKGVGNAMTEGDPYKSLVYVGGTLLALGALRTSQWLGCNIKGRYHNWKYPPPAPLPPPPDPPSELAQLVIDDLERVVEKAKFNGFDKLKTKGYVFCWVRDESSPITSNSFRVYLADSSRVVSDTISLTDMAVIRKKFEEKCKQLEEARVTKEREDMLAIARQIKRI